MDVASVRIEVCRNVYRTLAHASWKRTDYLWAGTR